MDWFKLNEESIIHGDSVLADGRRVILMSTKDCLKNLANAKTICGDGTFKITPAPWKQVMIISAEIIEDVWVPVAFGYLPDKKKDTYNMFFGLLKEALTKNGFELSAQYFMRDFETNLRNCAKDKLEIDILGCHFHYAKCMWKRVQANNLLQYHNQMFLKKSLWNA